MNQSAPVESTPLVPKVKRKSTVQKFFAQWDLQILVIPSLIVVFIFAYIPLYGLLMAFQDYQLGDFPGMSKWVGLKHFAQLVGDPNFLVMLRNTLVISGLKIAINFPAPILFALLVNELRNQTFKKTMQTISYLPHFISWVVAAAMLFDFFSPDNGAVNYALKQFGFIDRSVHFFGKGEYFWAMLVGTDLWKELGWGAIIYTAAITSIDSELYEAADIDGAGRFGKIWYITIASILPTIVLLFIFTLGGLLNANFDQIMMLTNQMGNAVLKPYADVIDTYVYRVGMRDSRFSFSSAAGLFKSLINFLLLISANKIADKINGSGVF